MSSKKASRVVALASRYQLRRGKTGDCIAQEDEGKDEESVSSRMPVVETKNKMVRGKKRKSAEIQYELESETAENCSSATENHNQKTKSPEGTNSSKNTMGVTEAGKGGDIPSPSCGGDEWRPSNWEKCLNNIREMRKMVEAPVDSMGCDQCHDTTTSPVIQRYQILVSLMLSSQTKDQVTFAAMGRLKKRGLTPQNIVSTETKVLEELIKPVGFYKRKSEYIKKASQILLDDYGGDIPDTVDKLCQLPGVGPKMAHICMNSAWNVVSGIGVDTHVHRISQRIGWLPPTVKRKKELTPEDTRKGLESWLPKSLWSEVNHLLVGFGQTICKPVGPSCNTCLNNSFCPSAKLKW